MLRALFVLTLVAANAVAVQTADCPEKLSVKATKLDVTMSLKKLLAIEAELAEEQEAAIKTAYEKLSNLDELEASYPLTKKANGRCLYEQSGDGIEKIELYSRGGKDRLYFQVELGRGTRGILARVYAEIESLSKTKVELVDEEGGLALAIPRYPYQSYSAGGTLQYVGDAGEIKASTR